jgi:hypothetical protein
MAESDETHTDLQRRIRRSGQQRTRLRIDTTRVCAGLRGSDCKNLPAQDGGARVESRCGAVSLGRTYLFPPLSSGSALVVRPWLHIPLIEPDVQISRIRLSDKTSRLCLACDAFCSS